MADQSTQTYYATSILKDPTALIAVALGIAQLPEVSEVLLEFGANIKVVNALLATSLFVTRWLNAVRPVAMIAMQSVKPVEVKQLAPTEQGTETKVIS